MHPEKYFTIYSFDDYPKKHTSQVSKRAIYFISIQKEYITSIEKNIFYVQVCKTEKPFIP